MLKNLFLRKSVIKQIALGYLIIMIAIISVFTVSMYMLYQNKNESVRMLIDQTTKQTMTQLDTHIKTLLDLSKIPLFYEDILISLGKSTQNEDLLHQLNKNVYQIYNNIINLSDEVYSISIQNRNWAEFNYIEGRTSLCLKEANTPWLSKSVEDFGVPNIISTYKEDVSVGEEWVFGVSRGLVEYNQSEVVGVININTRLEYIDSLIMPALLYDTQRILIMDRENYVIYDSRKIWTGRFCEDEPVLNMMEGMTSYSKILNNNLVIREDSHISGWTLLNIIPISDMNGAMSEYQRWMVWLVIAILLGVVAIMIMLFRSIVNPISKLIMNIELVKQGRLDDVVMEIDREDEFGVLTRSFNEMVQQLDILIHENYIKEVRGKELEMEMLQNQINPHFIYNTLEAINMVCQIEETYDASDMIMKLSSILRYGLSKKTEVVTLRDEISCVVQYLELQKIRFSNIEEYEIQVSEELMNAEILKLILQPIVENAVYHGLGRLNQGGEISIFAYQGNRDIVIVVHDNGVGIEDENVELLNDYINEKNDCFQSIGLRNVNVRIQIKYGMAYGVKLMCDSTGTSVFIRIPL